MAAASLPILDRYFRDRPVPSFPADPEPCEGQLLGFILQQGGSAAGPDGVPYEALQQLGRTTAWILGQAWHAADQCPDALEIVLGASCDLLVWIPKLPSPQSAGDCRPLQLPTCLRRLFGASVAAVLGPAIEPGFSAGQTAIRGGHCGINISRAFRHLAGDGPCCRGNGNPGLWLDLLGPAAECMSSWAGADPGLLRRTLPRPRPTRPIRTRRTACW